MLGRHLLFGELLGRPEIWSARKGGVHRRRVAGCAAGPDKSGVDEFDSHGAYHLRACKLK